MTAESGAHFSARGGCSLQVFRPLSSCELFCLLFVEEDAKLVAHLVVELVQRVLVLVARHRIRLLETNCCLYLGHARQDSRLLRSVPRDQAVEPIVWVH